MPPKSKTAAAANGSASKSRSATPMSTGSTTTPVPDKRETVEVSTKSGSGRPDKKVFDAEQERIKGDIDALQKKLSAVREKISLASKSDDGNDKRTALRAELDDIREKQAAIKASRSKVVDQIRAYEENIAKKNKDLQAAKAKIPFKTVAELDTRIKNLEKQVESGTMKLADEKRALQEISQCKRNRRTVESFQAEYDAIEADRQALAELKTKRDDPGAKAISERFEAIKAELDALKKEGEELYAGRSLLFKERDDVQAQINALYNEKRDSSQRFKEATDRYWAKVNEDRARRVERERAQRAAEEAQKRKEIAERLLEEAQMPAFQAQIEDCQTLVDFFSGKSSGTVTLKSTPLSPKVDIAGVPKLEIRQVDSAPEGLVARKKKGEDDDSYFVGGKGKGKGKKTPQLKTNASADPSSTQLNVPLPILSALFALSIPPLASSADVPRVIEDLKTKKAWFEANQTRVTAENIAKAEADIKRLHGETDVKDDGVPDVPASEVAPPNGGERPEVPALTSQTTNDVPSLAVPSAEVHQQLQSMQESTDS